MAEVYPPPSQTLAGLRAEQYNLPAGHTDALYIIDDSSSGSCSFSPEFAARTKRDPCTATGPRESCTPSIMMSYRSEDF